MLTGIPLWFPYIEMRMLINGAFHVCGRGFIVSCPLYMYDMYIGGAIASPMIIAGEVKN